MTATTRELAATYFRAWLDDDAEGLRGVLAPDVDFAGPMGVAQGPEACIAGLRGICEHVVRAIDVDLQLVDGADAMTWFWLHPRLPGLEPLAVVNRMHAGPAGLVRIRVVFDPRPLLG